MPRHDRLLAAGVAFLLSASALHAGVRQQDVTPEQRVKDFTTAVRDVMKLGSAASSPLTAQGKTESTATQTLLAAISHALKDKAAGEGVDTAPSATEAPIKRLVLASKDLLGLKDRAIEPLSAAAADPANEDVKAILTKAENRIYVALCVAEIRRYLGSDGQPSGTFDGMFAKLDKYNKEKIGDAFLDVFASSSPSGVRSLAGEGLAQTGSARHQAGVKAILGNQNEAQPIRMRALYTLARLGDRGPVDKQLADIEGRMKELKKPDMPAQELRAWAEGYRTMATIGQMIHDTDAAIRYYDSYIATIEPLKEKLGAQAVAGSLQNAYYNRACLHSLKGNVDGGLKDLEAAFAAGYDDYKWANTDGDLANLRKDPRWKPMIEKWESGKGHAESAPASKPS
jgi:hypothetical protein